MSNPWRFSTHLGARAAPTTETPNLFPVVLHGSPRVFKGAADAGGGCFGQKAGSWGGHSGRPWNPSGPDPCSNFTLSTWWVSAVVKQNLCEQLPPAVGALSPQKQETSSFQRNPGSQSASRVRDLGLAILLLQASSAWRAATTSVVLGSARPSWWCCLCGPSLTFSGLFMPGDRSGSLLFFFDPRGPVGRYKNPGPALSPLALLV